MHTLIQKTCFLVSFQAIAFAVISVVFGVIFYFLLNKIFSPNQHFMFSVDIIFPIIYNFSLIVLFLVSLRIRASNSMISGRSPQHEPRQRVHWDNDILSSKDLKTRPPKLSFFTQPSFTISQSMPYTGGFDTDEENVMLTSSTDHHNINYEATSTSNSSEPTNQD